MKILHCILVAVMLATGGTESFGQKIAVSTNLMDLMDLATLNADVSYAVSRHWSVYAAFKYNPWTFSSKKSGRQFQNRQQCYSAGGRYWLWHTYSGWWFSGRVQYQEYNNGGVRKATTEEGDRVGLGVDAGYTWMLHPHLNIELGTGLWGGYKSSVRYSCPSCGLTEEKSKGTFLSPDGIIISLSYVF